MSALRAILQSVGEGMAPDGTLMRASLRARLEALLTLLLMIVALGLAIGYQVLRHLPSAWRESLLGDDPPQ